MFRAWRRRLQLGLPTVLGWRRLGYFIPYRYAADLPVPGENPRYSAVSDCFEAARPAFEMILKAVENYRNNLLEFDGARPPLPRWQQDWFPRLDGAVAYCLVRMLAPKNIIEVGSGHSTRFMVQALSDGEIRAKFIAIDPAPRADLDALQSIELIRSPVQNIAPAVFEKLGAGDILFIDSSHIMMPGSDVDMMFNRVIPRLPAGVYIHIHDITLPDDYPVDWAWRGYNEQQGVMPMLLSGGFEPVWSSHYVAQDMKDSLATNFLASLPLGSDAHETSLWLRKK